MPIRSEAQRREPTARTRGLDACIDTLVGTPTGAGVPTRRAVHRVLACVGETDTTPNVLSWTREVARLFNADVTLIHVMRSVPPPAFYPAAGPIGFGTPAILSIPDKNAERERSESLLTDARSRLSDDVPEVSILHREGHPGDEIVRAARELASDLIIIGHHEGGALDRLLLGSTTDHVKNHTQADVLIARAPATPGPILSAVDGSPASRHAAQLGDEIAQRWSTPLHLLYVRLRPAHTPSGDITAAPLAGVEAALGIGEARDTIRGSAKALGVSLIALGSRGTSGLRSLMPGSVSNGLAHESPTSVLLVRDDASAR